VAEAAVAVVVADAAAIATDIRRQRYVVMH
jgi:hypothetical protein